jgi:tRNA(fMet)-specific endonuclease VapC
VSAAELLVGVELADSRRKRARREFVDRILATIPVEPYDLPVAQAHAALLVHSRREGAARGAHDLQIAATARARNRIVVTTDAAGFGELPGVSVRLAADRR